MSSIASIPPTGQSSTSDAGVASLGLPPVGLAQAASANTVNGALVASQFGVDAAAVSGVYGGSGAAGSNWFTNVELLPALSRLTKGTAEQSLALLGVKTEFPARAADTATTATTTPDIAPNTTSNTAIAPSENLGVAVVDPLWGKDA